MEFKGTKGNWHITRYYEELRSFLLLDDNNEQIASIDYEYIRNKDIVKANALLISKAPEMLEMLFNIVSAVEFSELQKECTTFIDESLINKAKTLIKQATEI